MTKSGMIKELAIRLSVVLPLLLAAPYSAHAQSLFAGRGLGFVGEPIDARARGLGGVAIGLPDGTLSFVNPAGTFGIPAPALHVTVQPDRFSAEFAGSEVSGETVRFPLIHVALPYRRWTASVGYATYLDRNWAVQRDTVLQIDGNDLQVGDRFASHGGVARLRFGGAYAVTPRLAIGVALDRYTGTVNDTTSREFLDAPLRPAIETNSMTFGGLGYGMGVRWVPSPAFAAGAAVTVGGTLDAESADSLAGTTSFNLPLTVAGGVSGRVTPTTLVAISGTWMGWSSVDGALAAAGGARDTWSLGGGIEWEAFRIGANVVPLRVGVRRSGLPFRWDPAAAGDRWANERSVSLGGGIRLGGGAAMLDAAVDRGTRGDADLGITESFWRISLSLTVLGR